MGRTPIVDAVLSQLAAEGVTDVDASARRRTEYASDASLYRVPPMAVVFPRNADEVAATLAACREHGVPITARGSGTSVAGNAVGAGVVLDVRRHLSTIHHVDPDARIAVVDPGVVLDDLQRALAPHGLRFGPEPSTHSRATLGGMVGNNACGSRALGHGRTVDHVIELDVLAGTGERLRAGSDPTGASSAVAAAVAQVAADHAGVLRDELGRFSRQISGYGLHHLLATNGSHLGRALVGSEGTCAITLGATLSLVPDPPEAVLLVLGYSDMASAADDVPALLAHDATTMEGIDSRIVDVVRTRRGDAAVPPLPDGAGWLFVEVAGDDAGEVRARASAIVADAGALGHLLVTDEAHARALWRIREDGAGLVARVVDRPVHAGWEDAAVPPARLGAYLRDFEHLLAQYQLAGVPFGHFGDGCVHVRLDFPFQRPSGATEFRAFLTDAARLVASHGGSLSGEHGDGRARSELLPHMYSPEALAAFAAFKAACDPDDLLNPGVLVRPSPVDEDLRAVLPRHEPDRTGFAYDEDGGSFAAAVHRCTGVGACVRPDAVEGAVMCPSYVATGDERDSTRGRARVLQEVVSGTLLPEGLASEAVYDALDLCLACKGCATDCPTGTDMATWKAEVLHQTYRRRLRPRSHYVLGWLPRWARLAGVAPTLATRLAAWAPVARVAKSVAGIDQRRPLPGFAPRRFRSAFDRRDDAPRGPAPRGPVVLWADTFTDRFAPPVAVAAVRVLEDAGYEVRLADDGLCCGLTWISTGQLDAARRRLRRTVDGLVEYARAGIPIVGLEPSCTAVLRSEARDLLGHDDPAAREVAAVARTLAEVLAAARPDWTPPRLDGVEVVAQPHCHHHAVMGWASDRALLAAAGATVTTLGGCCGLAGNFGMEQGHHDVSVAVAESALLPALRAAPDAVVLADGFSCRTQVEQLAGRSSLHLAELLAAHLD